MRMDTIWARARAHCSMAIGTPMRKLSWSVCSSKCHGPLSLICRDGVSKQAFFNIRIQEMVKAKAVPRAAPFTPKPKPKTSKE